jgi:3-hydroxyisobutyrate dehydrogenase
MESAAAALPTVGFIGLGDMGGPMAGHILDAGYPMLAFDVRPEAMEPLTARGATLAVNATALGSASDVVLVCVASAEQLMTLVTESLAGAMHAGSTLVVTSSVPPAAIIAAADTCASRGIAVLDCPVSGSRPAVEAGELTVMAGGDESALKKVAPILDTFSARIVHVGAIGTGQVMKIANNIMLHMNHLVALEALRFARSQGIDEQVLIDIVNSSTGRSWVTETWGLIDQMLIDHPQAGSPGVHDMFLKEMWNAVELSRTQRVSLPLTGLGVQVGRGLFREREDTLGIARNDTSAFA